MFIDRKTQYLFKRFTLFNFIDITMPVKYKNFLISINVLILKFIQKANEQKQ